MSDLKPDAAFEIAFFAIVQDLGLSKDELLQSKGRVGMHLDNAYKEYLATPESHRLNVLNTYAQTLVQKVRAANRAAENPGRTPPLPSLQDIFPVLRPRAYFVHSRLQAQAMSGAKSLKSSTFTIPFTDHFSVGLVVDDGKQMTTLTEEDVAGLGVEPDDLYELALENLRQAQPITLRELGPRVWASDEAGYGYDASLILLPEFAEKFSSHGTLAAFTTNSSRLLVTVLEDLNLDHPILKLVVESFVTHHHPLTAVPFILKDGTWKEAADVDGHPFLRYWRRSWVKERLDNITTQKALFTELKPELVFPETYSLGLDLAVGAEQGAAYTQMSNAERDKYVLPVSATDSPNGPGDPFFLTDTIIISFNGGAYKKTYLLKTLRLEVPGLIQSDGTYEPAIGYFTRLPTIEELKLVEEKQKIALRVMAGI